MSNHVYANGMEVSCKQAAGKSICAFPDVCMTPPQTPATPPGVPIPYPNTGMASDTTDGSSSVKISRQEVMLKNKSSFKKSTGDEAGSAPLKGVLTHKNTGKVYFTAWSMDVKIEGENVVRNLDLVTHNHASAPGNSPPWPYLDRAAVAAGTGPCKDEMAREQEACKDCRPNKKDGIDVCKQAGLTGKPGRAFDMEVVMPSGTASNRAEVLDMADRAEAEDCIRARRCELQPYKRKSGCCNGQTPHHLIEASSLFEQGRGPTKVNEPVDAHGPLACIPRGVPTYNEDDAPCVCAEGSTNTVGTHGFMHTHQSTLNADTGVEEEVEYFINGKTVKRKVKVHSYKQAKANANKAMLKVFPLSGCSAECIDAQLDDYHHKCGITDATKIGAVECGSTTPANVEFAEQNALERAMGNSPYFDGGTWTPEAGFGAPNLGFGILG